MAQKRTTRNRRDMAAMHGERNRATATFTPAVDIFERADMTVIVADMPGVAADDVDVTLDRQVLTLRGTVKPYAPKGYSRMASDCRIGDYVRVFTLADEIDRDGINATFKNGVLQLELPRAPKAKTQKMSVKGA